jgi:hypothetical protein
VTIPVTKDGRTCSPTCCPGTLACGDSIAAVSRMGCQVLSRRLDLGCQPTVELLPRLCSVAPDTERALRRTPVGVLAKCGLAGLGAAGHEHCADSRSPPVIAQARRRLPHKVSPRPSPFRVVATPPSRGPAPPQGGAATRALHGPPMRGPAVPPVGRIPLAAGDECPQVGCRNDARPTRSRSRSPSHLLLLPLRVELA